MTKQIAVPLPDDSITAPAGALDRIGVLLRRKDLTKAIHAAFDLD